MTKQIQRIIESFGREKKLLIYAGIMTLAPALLFAGWTSWLSGGENPQPKNSSAPFDISTHIPRGFVLVPIEVQNYESLDSVLGTKSIVDLFHVSSEPSKGRKVVARNVRLVRAPLNPTQFAVLIPETQADQILSQGSEFFVVIKPPSQVGTEFVREKVKMNRTIEYGDDR